MVERKIGPSASYALVVHRPTVRPNIFSAHAKRPSGFSACLYYLIFFVFSNKAGWQLKGSYFDARAENIPLCIPRLGCASAHTAAEHFPCAREAAERFQCMLVLSYFFRIF